MGKQYSIKVKDDEVVSVEVDGVSYTDPNDIPDPEDRDKVEALIAKSMGMDDDADEEFDAKFDEEFKKDFEEMERNSKKFPPLIMTIFLIIAVISLTVAGVSAYFSAKTVSREQSAPGKVIALVERSSYDSETRETTTFSYPKVEFRLPDGSLRQVQLNEGSYPPDYQAGDAVTILYDPDQPNNARIKSASSTVLMWLLPGITGILGLAFLGAALMVWKFFGSDEPKDNRPSAVGSSA